MGMMPGQPMMHPGMMANPAMQMQQNLMNYRSLVERIFPGLVPDNPNYKNQVGEVIYEFVEKLSGEEKAPKITGMLIDLPIEEIREYLQNYAKFEDKVNEAAKLLDRNAGGNA